MSNRSLKYISRYVPAISPPGIFNIVQLCSGRCKVKIPADLLFDMVISKYSKCLWYHYSCGKSLIIAISCNTHKTRNIIKFLKKNIIFGTCLCQNIISEKFILKYSLDRYQNQRLCYNLLWTLKFATYAKLFKCGNFILYLRTSKFTSFPIFQKAFKV